MSGLKILAIALLTGFCMACSLIQLPDRYQEQKTELQNLRWQYQELEKKHYALLEQISQKKFAEDRRLRELEQEVKKLRAEKEQVETSLRQLNEQLRQTLEEETQAARQREEELTQVIAQVKKSLEEESRRTSQWQAQAREQEQKANRLQQSLDQARTRLQTAERELETAQQQADKLSSSRSSLDRQITQLKSEVAKKDAEIKRLEKAVSKEKAAPSKPAAPPDLDDLYESLRAALDSERKRGDVRIEKQADSVRMIIFAHNLYAPSSVILTEEGKQLLQRVAGAMADYGDWQVLVEGHTDSQPIGELPFYDNWGLGSQRANNVVRFFVEEAGISGSRLRSSSCSYFYSLSSNNTAEGRRQNRRIELHFHKK